jgi:hypothetical protein
MTFSLHAQAQKLLWTLAHEMGEATRATNQTWQEDLAMALEGFSTLLERFPEWNPEAPVSDTEESPVWLHLMWTAFQHGNLDLPFSGRPWDTARTPALQSAMQPWIERLEKAGVSTWQALPWELPFMTLVAEGRVRVDTTWASKGSGETTRSHGPFGMAIRAGAEGLVRTMLARPECPPAKMLEVQHAQVRYFHRKSLLSSVLEVPSFRTLLLDAGFSPDGPGVDESHANPLFEAQTTESLTALIDAGANLLAVSSDGWHFAGQVAFGGRPAGKADLVRLWQQALKDQGLSAPPVEEPLMAAIFQGQVEQAGSLGLSAFLKTGGQVPRAATGKSAIRDLPALSWGPLGAAVQAMRQSSNMGWNLFDPFLAVRSVSPTVWSEASRGIPDILALAFIATDYQHNNTPSDGFRQRFDRALARFEPDATRRFERYVEAIPGWGEHWSDYSLPKVVTRTWTQISGIRKTLPIESTGLSFASLGQAAQNALVSATLDVALRPNLDADTLSALLTGVAKAITADDVHAHPAILCPMLAACAILAETTTGGTYGRRPPPADFHTLLLVAVADGTLPEESTMSDALVRLLNRSPSTRDLWLRQSLDRDLPPADTTPLPDQPRRIRL